MGIDVWANTFETAQMVGTVILTQNGQWLGHEGDTLMANDDIPGIDSEDRPGASRRASVISIQKTRLGQSP